MTEATHENVGWRAGSLLGIRRTDASTEVPSPRAPGTWWSPLRSSGARPLFIAGDAIAVLAVAAAVGQFWPYVVGLGLLAMLLFATGGLYRSRLTLSLLDDLPVLTGKFAIATVIVVVMSVVIAAQGYASAGAWQERLEAMALIGPVALYAAMVATRGAVYGAVRHLRRRDGIAHRALIIGTDQTARALVHALQEHPEHGLRPIGHLESEHPDYAQTDLPVMGEPAQLGRLLDATGASVVIVSFGLGPETTLLQVIRSAHRRHAEVFVVPRLHELHPAAADVEHVWGTPLVRLPRAAYRSPLWRLKRALDVAVSGVALVVLSPVLAACAVAVRLDGGPGVIFRQQRVGVDGRRFELLKFRSLRPASSEESATTWNIAHDDRLSGVGRFLRRTSLDELPQLWNILRGDMSLVGPRPERPHFVDQFAALYPSYGDRHRVPCGLTGWAQVNGLRGDTSIEHRARFDNFYVENWSLWFDVKIMIRTVGSVVTAKGG
jgi:exopolysaccharide biosynthesis polyprenyl glycosylphosphotransferase